MGRFAVDVIRADFCPIAASGMTQAKRAVAGSLLSFDVRRRLDL
jgi:hypothetical protein